MTAPPAVAQRSLSEVLADLRLPPARLRVLHLARVVSLVARSEHLWQPLVRHDPRQRWYTRLHFDPRLEVWLIGWEIGQDTRLHDHGGASGAFSVCQGTLVEDYGRRATRPPLATGRRVVGSCRSFGPDYLHNLVNAGPHVATSIHAYSPPLQSMTFYDQRGDVFAPVRTMPVSGPEPGVTAAQAAGAWVQPR